MQEFWIKDREFLDSLYMLNTLTSNRIAEVFQCNTSSVKRFFKRLEYSYSIVLKPDIMHSRMGLSMVFMLLRNVKIACLKDLRSIIKKIPYGKGLALVLPKSLLIVLQIPWWVSIQDIEEERNIKVWKMDYVIRSKPVTPMLDLVIRGRFDDVTKQSFDVLSGAGLNVDIDSLLHRYTFDGLDLELLKRLELDPSLTLRELAEAVKSKVKIVEKHVEKHCEKLILGYRISRIYLLSEYSKMAYVFVFKCKQSIELYCRFVRHPYILSCLGSQTGNTIVISVIPYGQAFTFSNTVIDAAETLGCEFTEMFAYSINPDHFVSATIPTKMSGEYNPKHHGWNNANIREVLELIRKELCVDYVEKHTG